GRHTLKDRPAGGICLPARDSAGGGQKQLGEGQCQSPIRPSPLSTSRMMLRWLLGALLVLLSGCVPSPSDRQTIRFWGMGREGEVVARLLPEFERRNPDIRVRVQQLPWTAAHEKLLTAYAGDSLPDLCQLGNTWVPEFAALRALAELKPEVAASRVIAAEDYF